MLVPLPAETRGGRLVLVVRSAVNLTEARSGDGARAVRSMYAEFPMTLPADMPEGSYEYRVEEDGEAVASGVAQLGGFSPDVVQYERETVYEQYEGRKAG